jgi:hypothetical protein
MTIAHDNAGWPRPAFDVDVLSLVAASAGRPIPFVISNGRLLFTLIRQSHFLY